MKVSIQSFGGVAPKVNPRYLPGSGAQVALNVEAYGQSVKPLKGLSAALSGPVLVGSVQTVYRAGLNAPNDTEFWLSWPTDVDVCRAQIASDDQEWHFWTGDLTPADYPKAGCSALTITGQPKPYPQDAHIRLGLPAPTVAPAGAVNYVEPTKTAPKLVLTASILAEFSTWNYQTQSCDVRVALSKASDGVTLDWYYPTYIDMTKVSLPVITLTTMSALSKEAGLILSVDGEITTSFIRLADLVGDMTASDVASAINAQARLYGVQFVDAVVSGSTVVITSRVAGGPVRFVARWGSDDYSQRIMVVGAPLSPAACLSSFQGAWQSLYRPGDAPVAGTTYMDAVIDGTSLVVTSKMVANGGGYCTKPPWDTKTSCEANGGTWMPASFMSLRWGEELYQQMIAYGTTENKGTFTSHPYIYTWVAHGNYVTPSGLGLKFESAPSPASDIANVYADSSVLVQIFTDPDGAGPLGAIFPAGSTVHGTAPDEWLSIPGGYTVHGIRLYRAVSGVYLLVEDESVLTISKLKTQDPTLIDANGNGYYCYKDDKDADELGEPCPSIGWSEPPAALRGLINLPNGIMAGFVDRDLYLSEPYRPYAWPESYINTVDYKIVGLGRMDTTLAVLTEGSPYFVQGSSPATAVVVKSDLEQSCVSKRSIVSMGGTVLYASPDGLMMLSPGGSSNLTDGVFDRTEWQRILGATPSTTFRAFGHDGKYVAFHTSVVDSRHSDVTYTGFIVDLRSKQFVRHDFTCAAGYADPVNDHLYIVRPGSGALYKWGEGADAPGGRWISKVFAMPQIVGFSCGQVEAEAYDANLKCRVYRTAQTAVGGATTRVKHGTALTADVLTSRVPFRLEAAQGRDWEIDLAVSKEIFNVVLAQSMDEIAGA